MDASLDRDRASRLLHEHADELRRLGVRHLGIVGSLARDEATLSSDVDMLIEVAADRPFSLWALGEVRVRLSEILGREADVLIAKELEPSPAGELGAGPAAGLLMARRFRPERLRHILEAITDIETLTCGKVLDATSERLILCV